MVFSRLMMMAAVPAVVVANTPLKCLIDSDGLGSGYECHDSEAGSMLHADGETGQGTCYKETHGCLMISGDNWTTGWGCFATQDATDAGNVFVGLSMLNPNQGERVTSFQVCHEDGCGGPCKGGWKWWVYVLVIGGATLGGCGLYVVYQKMTQQPPVASAPEQAANSAEVVPVESAASSASGSSSEGSSAA